MIATSFSANLRAVLLANNKLSGPVPEEIGRLKKLTDLRLNRNPLSGTIPGSLAGTASLQGPAPGPQSPGRIHPKRPCRAPDGVRCLAQSGIGAGAVAQRNGRNSAIWTRVSEVRIPSPRPFQFNNLQQSFILPSSCVSPFCIRLANSLVQLSSARFLLLRNIQHSPRLQVRRKFLI